MERNPPRPIVSLMEMAAERMRKTMMEDIMETEKTIEDTMNEPKMIYVCDCGKQHDGGKIGVNLTRICQDCLTAKKRATMDAKKPGFNPYPTISLPQVSIPRTDESLVIEISRRVFPDLLEWLIARSKEQLRTPEMQAVWELMQRNQGQPQRG
jgi:hypothetical protein